MYQIFKYFTLIPKSIHCTSSKKLSLLPFWIVIYSMWTLLSNLQLDRVAAAGGGQDGCIKAREEGCSRPILIMGCSGLEIS